MDVEVNYLMLAKYREIHRFLASPWQLKVTVSELILVVKVKLNIWQSHG